MPIKDFLIDASPGIAVYKRERVGAMPFDIDDRDGAVGHDPANRGVWLELFEFHLSFVSPMASLNASIHPSGV